MLTRTDIEKILEKHNRCFISCSEISFWEDDYRIDEEKEFSRKCNDWVIKSNEKPYTTIFLKHGNLYAYMKGNYPKEVEEIEQKQKEDDQC